MCHQVAIRSQKHTSKHLDKQYQAHHNTSYQTYYTLCKKLTDTQTLPSLRDIYILEGLALVKFCTSQNWAYIWSSTYDVCIREYSWNQTPLHWNQTDCSMTTMLPVLLSSSILPPLSSHSAITSSKENSNVHFKNVISKEKMHVWSCINWNSVICRESVQCEPSTDLTINISCLLNNLGLLVHQHTLK